VVARRETRDRRQSEPDLQRILCDGHVYQGDHSGRPLPCPTLDELRDEWAESGPELTAAHVAKAPGTRPWAWWAFSCQSLPTWTWELNQYGHLDGIPALNRNRPSDLQQFEHLTTIGQITPAELAAVRASLVQSVTCLGRFPEKTA
jgi:hypothetical protein